jgi:hypothetical protein
MSPLVRHLQDFTLYSYDTGTIGGVIAMDDWLNTFGKRNPAIAGPYLPREPSSVPYLHSLWQTKLAENGVSLLLVVFSALEWDYSLTRIGRLSWLDVVC